MMDYITKIIKSKRKTVGFEINAAGNLIVRVPLYMDIKDINKVISKHQPWINKHMQEFHNRKEISSKLPQFTKEQIEKMAREALDVIPPKVEKYAAIIGVQYGRITIRNQRTRWGSCSSKGNLNFNCLLTQMPEEVMDYVIVHELCHRIEMNHSKKFWDLVGNILPDYNEQKKWLKENGSKLIDRI